MAALLIAALAPLDPAAATVEKRPAIDRALARLYNFDFTGAHAILDAYIEGQPQDPFGYAFRGAAYLFYELDRLKILESEFLRNDEKIAGKHKPKPDIEIRDLMLGALDRTLELAEGRLATNPEDVDALFALCLREGVLTDYRGLVERRGIRGLSSARAANRHAVRLLKLEPDYYDAYLISGGNEYLIGSLPFFVRWFVRMEGIEGSKDRAFERLEVVAKRGVYLGPFARILMSIMALREDRVDQARDLLAGLNRDYPENRLIRKELTKITEEMSAAGAITSPQ